MPQEISEKQALLKSLPIGDEELYTTYKKLEAHLEFLQLQEVRTVCYQQSRGDSPCTAISSSNGDLNHIDTNAIVSDIAGVHQR